MSSTPAYLVTLDHELSGLIAQLLQQAASTAQLTATVHAFSSLVCRLCDSVSTPSQPADPPLPASHPYHPDLPLPHSSALQLSCLLVLGPEGLAATRQLTEHAQLLALWLSGALRLTKAAASSALPGPLSPDVVAVWSCLKGVTGLQSRDVHVREAAVQLLGCILLHHTLVQQPSSASGALQQQLKQQQQQQQPLPLWRVCEELLVQVGSEDPEPRVRAAALAAGTPLLACYLACSPWAVPHPSPGQLGSFQAAGQQQEGQGRQGSQQAVPEGRVAQGAVLCLAALLAGCTEADGATTSTVQGAALAGLRQLGVLAPAPAAPPTLPLPPAPDVMQQLLGMLVATFHKAASVEGGPLTSSRRPALLARGVAGLLLLLQHNIRGGGALRLPWGTATPSLGANGSLLCNSSDSSSSSSSSILGESPSLPPLLTSSLTWAAQAHTIISQHSSSSSSSCCPSSSTQSWRDAPSPSPLPPGHTSPLGAAGGPGPGERRQGGQGRRGVREPAPLGLDEWAQRIAAAGGEEETEEGQGVGEGEEEGWESGEEEGEGTEAAGSSQPDGKAVQEALAVRAAMQMMWRGLGGRGLGLGGGLGVGGPAGQQAGHGPVLGQVQVLCQGEVPSAGEGSHHGLRQAQPPPIPWEAPLPASQEWQWQQALGCLEEAALQLPLSTACPAVGAGGWPGAAPRLLLVLHAMLAMAQGLSGLCRGAQPLASPTAVVARVLGGMSEARANGVAPDAPGLAAASRVNKAGVLPAALVTRLLRVCDAVVSAVELPLARLYEQPGSAPSAPQHPDALFEAQERRRSTEAACDILAILAPLVIRCCREEHRPLAPIARPTRERAAAVNGTSPSPRSHGVADRGNGTPTGTSTRVVIEELDGDAGTATESERIARQPGSGSRDESDPGADRAAMLAFVQRLLLLLATHLHDPDLPTPWSLLPSAAAAPNSSTSYNRSPTPTASYPAAAAAAAAASKANNSSSGSRGGNKGNCSSGSSMNSNGTNHQGGQSTSPWCFLPLPRAPGQPAAAAAAAAAAVEVAAAASGPPQHQSPTSDSKCVQMLVSRDPGPAPPPSTKLTATATNTVQGQVEGGGLASPRGGPHSPSPGHGCSGGVAGGSATEGVGHEGGGWGLLLALAASLPVPDAAVQGDAGFWCGGEAGEGGGEEGGEGRPQGVGGPWAADRKQVAEQRLLAAGAWQLLPPLRRVLLPAAAAARQDLNQAPFLSPLLPPLWDRLLAARRLAWFTRALNHPWLSACLPVALPAALAAVDDPSMAVAEHGMRTLEHIAREGLAADLRWQGPLLLDTALRLVLGAEAEVWAPACQAAVALTLAVEGPAAQRAAAPHRLIVELLARGERHAQDAAWVAPLLAPAVLPRLLAALGLACLRHTARLLPLLGDWLCAPAPQTRRLAADCLSVLISHTWPRMPHHAAPLWQHLAVAWALAAATLPAPALAQVLGNSLVRGRPAMGGPSLGHTSPATLSHNEAQGSRGVNRFGSGGGGGAGGQQILEDGLAGRHEVSEMGAKGVERCDKGHEQRLGAKGREGSEEGQQEEAEAVWRAVQLLAACGGPAFVREVRETESRVTTERLAGNREESGQVPTLLDWQPAGLIAREMWATVGQKERSAVLLLTQATLTLIDTKPR